MRLTFLGTGTSFGVPVVGCGCATCRSTDARDQRTRSGALLQSAGVTLLIDSPPELRLQLLGQGVRTLDAVLYTHEHADHTAGIDDLRIFTARRGGHLPVYGPPETLDALRDTYRYIFDPAVTEFAGTTKPHLEPRPLAPGVATEVAGIPVLPLAFPHGHLRVYGYRFGRLAYLTDVKAVGAAERQALQGLDVLVVNALLSEPHPTHLSIDEAVALARDLGARQTFLTHLTHAHRHADLAARLPHGVAPAFDGLAVEIA